MSGALISLPFLGRTFLPEFNEGTLNISLVTQPGTGLEESSTIGRMAESILLAHDAVISTARRTGRTEADEHSLGSHAHELEVRLDLSHQSKHEVIDTLRNRLALLPGTNVTIGQPISHRIDHMLSGTRAAIAVKVFGPELEQLSKLAEQVRVQIESVPGAVDLYVDKPSNVPQVRIIPDRSRMALHGLNPADVDSMMDVAFLGHAASSVRRGDVTHDLVVRYAREHRNSIHAIRRSLIHTPAGDVLPLEQIAEVREDVGPLYIQRENVQRKVVIQANVADRDLHAVVSDIRSRIAGDITLPPEYRIEIGGQFESEQRATRTILLLSIVSIAAILLLLYVEFRSVRQAVLAMVNLPLALFGGIAALHLSSGVLSIASLVGFITLFGIAVRNGILMISQYNYLIDVQGLSIEDAVTQGSLDRLSPILMTALTTGLALVPLALAADQPGAELEAPMAIVILGGLLSAVFLNLVVIPALYLRWGRR